MKKLSFLTFVFLLFVSGAFAQNTATAEKELYDPKADAEADIAKAIAQANSEGKHVFLQIGGNWCGWCKWFDKKVTTNDTLRISLEENYVVYHLNVSQENGNADVLASLGYPQRFGFPVFVILDGKGNRLHTQNSVYLEEGKGHNTQKVLTFFKQWSPSALKAEQYKR